jgi:hypothetical protein
MFWKDKHVPPAYQAHYWMTVYPANIVEQDGREDMDSYGASN